MAVNHYWNAPDAAGRAVMVTATELGLRMLRRSPVVGSIALVDGSPEPDARLAAVCEELDAEYIHTGRELGLAEGYNLGWRSLPEPYVGLMANDIVPFPLQSLDRLLELVQQPDVGLAFPYLTLCDYAPQLARSGAIGRRTMVSCEPASMTLNLCVLRREVLERVGGVDTAYATGFYDPIMVMRVRELGYRAVQAGDTWVVHLDRLTKTFGGSTLTPKVHAGDRERFFARYPHLQTEHGIWGIRFWRWPMAMTRPAALLWWLSQRLPSRRARRAAESTASFLEPLLTRYPVGRASRTAPDPSAVPDPVSPVLAAFARAREGRPLRFVQIGANDGTTGDPLRELSERHAWSGVLVEPVPYVFARLQDARGADPRLCLENAAIAASDGEAELHHLRERADGEQLPDWYDQLGSFSLPTILWHEDQIPDLRERLVTTKVPTLTFDSLCARHALDAFDLLHIDVEGYDWEVLRQVDLDRYRPAVVLYEHAHLADADRAAAVERLSAHGYACHPGRYDTIAVRADELEREPALQRVWLRVQGARPAGRGDETPRPAAAGA
jgi:FkbM family methyltransferase